MAGSQTHASELINFAVIPNSFQGDHVPILHPSCTLVHHVLSIPGGFLSHPFANRVRTFRIDLNALPGENAGFDTSAAPALTNRRSKRFQDRDEQLEALEVAWDPTEAEDSMLYAQRASDRNTLFHAFGWGASGKSARPEAAAMSHSKTDCPGPLSQE